MELTTDLKKILDVGIALTAERDYNVLLEKLLKEFTEITNSDAATIYIKEPEGLRFKIMLNKTLNTYQGGDGEVIDMPVVPFEEENVCAYCAIHRRIVNIPDVHCNEEFDFKGPIYYDKITNYRTKSMLVIPLENHEGEILGVVQLINAMDEEGNVITYDKKYEYIIYSLASEVAVTMSNMAHMEEMRKLLYSMVSAFTAAIDERTPYNANHTKNVAAYTEELVDYIREAYQSGETSIHISRERKEQLVMAAMLHDVGKLITPLDIMNKESRLDAGLPVVLERFRLIASWIKIDYLEGHMTREDWEKEENYLEEMENLVVRVNTAEFLDEDTLSKIEELKGKHYQGKAGEACSYITEEEGNNLCIRKGTLSEKERETIEYHVVMTEKLLGKIRFGKRFEKVTQYASEHHEFLNGSGYPKHLTGPELSNETRILTVIDIFESLTTADRPYKKAIPTDKAFAILYEMAEEGKLDREIVNLWECCMRKNKISLKNV